MMLSFTAYHERGAGGRRVRELARAGPPAERAAARRLASFRVGHGHRVASGVGDGDALAGRAVAPAIRVGSDTAARAGAQVHRADPIARRLVRDGHGRRVEHDLHLVAHRRAGPERVIRRERQRDTPGCDLARRRRVARIQTRSGGVERSHATAPRGARRAAAKRARKLHLGHGDRTRELIRTGIHRGRRADEDRHLVADLRTRTRRGGARQREGDDSGSEFRRRGRVARIQGRSARTERARAAAPRAAGHAAGHRALELDARAARAHGLIGAGVGDRDRDDGDLHLIAQRAARSGRVVGGERQRHAPGPDLGC